MKTILLAGLVPFAVPSPPAPGPATGEPANETVWTEPADGQAPASSDDFRVYWKNGLRLDNADKTFRLKIGGRIHWDVGFASSDDFDDAGISTEDGTKFRRARLYMAGEIHENIEFKAEYDFAGTQSQSDTVDTSTGDVETVTFDDARPSFKDVYIGVNETVVGNLRFGHFKEPFGLEELTSSNHITFMERSTATEAFSPSRNSGVMAFDTFTSDERGTWSIGIFRDTDDAGFDVGDGYAVTGRATFLPMYEDEGARLVHLGAAYSVRDADDDSARYRSRPEDNFIGRVVDTGSIAADGSDLAGLELAWVAGPFSLQGEYMMAMVDPSSGSDLDFDGYYAQASYWLTGEHRAYKKSGGAFDRVSPKRNLGEEGGFGAVELAARYSSTNLDDGSVSGGEVDTIALGANWHLNPNTRVMLDYVRPDEDTIGDADLLLMRFQIDF